MNEKQIRTFIAVALPDDVKESLGQVNAALARPLPPRAVRWVKPSRMHITLRFLGDTAVSRLPTIAAQLDTLTARYQPFNLIVSGLGCFPNRQRPRVIWAGLQGDVAPAQSLALAINDMLSPLGWEPEKRPFKPHLTLGRVRDAGQVRGVSWEVPLAEMIMEITAVCLIESQLTPQGPLYTTRHISQFVSG
jgi:2'-5' RNA ligase